MSSTGVQHYVWSHYLEAWQDADGLVHCSRNGGAPFATNPRNIMAEREFYKLARITVADAKFLKKFVRSTASESLRQSHEYLIDVFAFASTANELIQNVDTATIEEKRLAQDVIVKMEDELHGQIEQQALPVLNALQLKRVDFLRKDSSAIAFFRYIAHQYFRTKRSRAEVSKELARIGPDGSLSRLSNVVCHIGAENLGASLYVDRNDFDIVFLSDEEDVGFITGDQPIVNLLGTGDARETTELVLYYPLTPKLACLVIPKEHGLCSQNVGAEAVEALNDYIVAESGSVLIANSDAYLERVVRKNWSTRPGVRNILDSLDKASR